MNEVAGCEQATMFCGIEVSAGSLTRLRREGLGTGGFIDTRRGSYSYQ